MQVMDPFYFAIDNSDNILISDKDSDSILLFNPKFEYLRTITVSNFPMGITVDNLGRIIVVSQSKNNCLQIY